MTEQKTETGGLTLPLVPLRDIAIYPKMTVNLDIGRKESADAVRLASKDDRYIVTVMQKKANVEAVDMDDLYTVGTVVRINQMLQLPGGLIRVLAEGVSRVKVLSVFKGSRCLMAEVDDMAETVPEDELKAEAYRRTILKEFFEWLRNTKQGLPDEQMEQLKQITDAGETADFLASPAAYHAPTPPGRAGRNGYHGPSPSGAPSAGPGNPDWTAGSRNQW